MWRKPGDLLAVLHGDLRSALAGLCWNTAELLLPCAVRILWKKNEVADYEATTFSIFYNNTLFLVLVIVASFFLLKNFNPTVYPFSQTRLVKLLCFLSSKTQSKAGKLLGACAAHIQESSAAVPPEFCFS